MQQITKKLQRREQILDGLFMAMAKTGSGNSSVTEIATSAGIARGALHYYFESKDEIRVALMARLGDRYLSRLERAVQRHAGNGERMLAALFAFHFSGDMTQTARLMSVWIDYWGQAQTDPAVHREVLRVQRGARATVAEVVAAHVGGVVDESDARCASILALIEGSLLQWRIAQGSDAPLCPDALRVQLGAATRALLSGPPGGSSSPKPPSAKFASTKAAAPNNSAPNNSAPTAA